MTQEAADLWARALQAFHTSRREAVTDPDTAASRAYYAAFYAVSAMFILEGKNFSRHSPSKSPSIATWSMLVAGPPN